MQLEKMARPGRQSLLDVELEARRMRAEIVRGAGSALGRSLARLFGWGGSSRKPART